MGKRYISGVGQENIQEGRGTLANSEAGTSVEQRRGRSSDMQEHTRGHVLGKNGKKNGGRLCVSMFSELKLGVLVVNACVLRKHDHIINHLKQDSFEGERSCWQ